MYHLSTTKKWGQDEAEKHRTEAAVKVSSQAGDPKLAGWFLETGKSQSKMDGNWG